jgi:hypothetical protein
MRRAGESHLGCLREYGGAAHDPEFLHSGWYPRRQLMSITAWIVPGQNAGWAAARCDPGWANR